MRGTICKTVHGPYPRFMSGTAKSVFLPGLTLFRFPDVLTHPKPSLEMLSNDDNDTVTVADIHGRTESGKSFYFKLRWIRIHLLVLQEHLPFHRSHSTSFYERFRSLFLSLSTLATLWLEFKSVFLCDEGTLLKHNFLLIHTHSSCCRLFCISSFSFSFFSM